MLGKQKNDILGYGRGGSGKNSTNDRTSEAPNIYFFFDLQRCPSLYLQSWLIDENHSKIQNVFRNSTMRAQERLQSQFLRVLQFSPPIPTEENNPLSHNCNRKHLVSSIMIKTIVYLVLFYLRLATKCIIVRPWSESRAISL